MDILTTDNSMKERSYREFLRRLDRMPDMKLPSWRLPEIEVVRAYPYSKPSGFYHLTYDSRLEIAVI